MILLRSKAYIIFKLDLVDGLVNTGGDGTRKFVPRLVDRVAPPECCQSLRRASRRSTSTVTEVERSTFLMPLWFAEQDGPVRPSSVPPQPSGDL